MKETLRNQKMNFKKSNIYAVEISRGKNGEDEEEQILKVIMAKNFPGMNKQISHEVYGSTKSQQDE